MTVGLNVFGGRPVAPRAVPPAVVRWEGDASNFTDLLQGLVQSCVGAPGFLADMASSDQRENASQPGADAKIFNEDGLFQGAPSSVNGLPDSDAARAAVGDDKVERVAWLGEPPSERLTLPASQQTLAATIASAPDFQTDRSDIVQQNRFLASELRVEGAVNSAAGTPRVNRNATIVGAGIIPPESAMAERTDGESVLTRAPSFRSRVTALLPRLWSQERATLNVQVSVTAVENGLRVVARLDELGREERVKLRDRIAAILSRHGFVGRDVVLNGQARPISRTSVEER